MLSCYSHPTLIRTSAWLSFRISDLRRSRTCWWCPGTVGGKVIFMGGGVVIPILEIPLPNNVPYS